MSATGGTKAAVRATKETYFQMESAGSGPASPVGFDELLRRLRALLVTQTHHGQWTERSLARRLGISQPHLHHVLSGERRLTAALADRILRQLRMSVADLLEEPEIPHRKPVQRQLLPETPKVAMR